MTGESSALKFMPIAPETEAVGKVILDSAYAVHTALGPGLLESVYEACTAHEARQRGLSVETQVGLPVEYYGIRVDPGLRINLWANKLVIVELKGVESMIPLYDAQLLTYLKLTGCRFGFLINFNVRRLRDGIKRMVV